jgi:hypothetical protein
MLARTGGPDQRLRAGFRLLLDESDNEAPCMPWALASNRPARYSAPHRDHVIVSRGNLYVCETCGAIGDGDRMRPLQSGAGR